MMLVRILGLLDFLTGIMILLQNYNVLKGARVFLSFIVYLILKGIIFRGDFASFVDLIIAIFMIFMLFFHIPILAYLAAIYLFQKSITSFI